MTVTMLGPSGPQLPWI